MTKTTKNYIIIRRGKREEKIVDDRMTEESEMSYELWAVLRAIEEEYSDCKISDDDKEAIAVKLYNHIFVNDGDINDILWAVYAFEKRMRAKGITIEVGRQCSVYSSLINFLEINEKNAQRMFTSFMGYHDVQAFNYLMNEYREYLSAEQTEDILEVAKEAFVEDVWESYI